MLEPKSTLSATLSHMVKASIKISAYLIKGTKTVQSQSSYDVYLIIHPFNQVIVLVLGLSLKDLRTCSKDHVLLLFDTT